MGKFATQEGRVLRMLKESKRGVTNGEFAKAHVLRYGSYIHILRKEGHNIIKTRDLLADGKASNTWRYYLQPKARKYTKHKSDAGELLEEPKHSNWFMEKMGML